ncbi:hypothetical protein JCM10212_004205 [Sporobolomyces blumeae]
MDSRGDRAPIVLSKEYLLNLYASPLVPRSLEGMKPLSEWYGEYTTPPSPPVQRPHLPSTPSASRLGSNSSSSTSTSTGNRRALAPFTSSENPFANFGRFGVDGGLGEPLELPGRRRNGQASALSGRAAGGRDGAGGGGGTGDPEKDLAPHLVGTGSRRAQKDSDAGWSDSPAKDRRDQFFKEERTARGLGSSARNGGDALDASSGRRGRANGGIRDGLGEAEAGTPARKDRRGLGPADEGGWRSVGTTREEREKRLLRNQGTATASGRDYVESPRRFERGDRGDRLERGDRHDRDRDRDRPSRTGGGPAWMHDDEPSSGSSPSWMDVPATGQLSFSGGKVTAAGLDDRDDSLEVSSPAQSKRNPNEWVPAGSGGGGAGEGGVDSIQQWKMQMKEMERKEREKELRAQGIEPEPERQAPTTQETSVFSALTSPKPEPAAAQKSILEDLGIVRSPAISSATAPPPGLSKPDSSSNVEEGGSSGRGSRFARFFDGKPQSPQPQAQQPPASVFGALLGGGAGGAHETAKGPSKEDAESMARLLGMLQVQGSRTGSPTATRDARPESTANAAPSPAASSDPQPPQQSSIAQASPVGDESRSSSRFKFSTSKNSPSVQSSQPASAVHSPSAPGPPNMPISSPPPPLPGFAGFAQQTQQAQVAPSHAHPHATLSNLPQVMSPGDALRSPPLPLPPSQSMAHNHPRTLSSHGEALPSRGVVPNHAVSHSNPTSPPLNHPMNHPHHPVHQNGPFPPSLPSPQQYLKSHAPGPGGAQGVPQRMPPPPGGIPPPPMGMFPSGPPPAPQQQQHPFPPHQGMMSPDLARTLGSPNGNINGGIRSPPPPPTSTMLGPNGQPFPSGMVPPPPPHGVRGAAGPGSIPPQMMFPPPPPPPGYLPPPQFAQHQQQQRGGVGPGALGGMMQGGASLGGNAGADLMALLNSGSGGMRIGGQAPPPPPPLHQQHGQPGHSHQNGPPGAQFHHPGNLPPFMMEGR